MLLPNDARGFKQPESSYAAEPRPGIPNSDEKHPSLCH